MPLLFGGDGEHIVCGDYLRWQGEWCRRRIGGRVIEIHLLCSGCACI